MQMNHPVRLVIIILTIANGLSTSESDAADTVPTPSFVRTQDLSKLLMSSVFNPEEFNRMWSEYYARQKSENRINTDAWVPKLDRILASAVMSNNSLALETVLDLSITGVDSVFDPNRALFMVSMAKNVDDEAAAKMARLLMEYGASPMMTGLTADPEMAQMTPVEIVIRQRKPKVLEAFLQDPSPVSYESLEQLSEYGPRIRRGIEIFRTLVVRQISRIRQEDELHGREEADSKKADSMRATLFDQNFYLFAQRYLEMLSIFLVYLVVIALMIVFLYHTRIKQVPHPETLMRPRDEGSLLSYLHILFSISLTSAPGGTMMEMFAHGTALAGSLIWSHIWTDREDIVLSLVLATVLQSLVTGVCYMSFAPTGSRDIELAELQERPVFKLMFYPRSADLHRAVSVAGNYLVSCAMTMLLLYGILRPVKRMYFCPTTSVSDTYGFPYSLTRAVAFTWDVIIFFVMSFRVYRLIDTLVVYKLVQRIWHSSEEASELENESEQTLLNTLEGKDSSLVNSVINNIHYSQSRPHIL